VARLAGLGQLAECGALPISIERVVRAIRPGRIAADAGHADEEIDVAPQLGERDRIDLIERDRLAC
jgi:hypothetical protein